MEWEGRGRGGGGSDNFLSTYIEVETKRKKKTKLATIVHSKCARLYKNVVTIVIQIRNCNFMKELSWLKLTGKQNECSK